MPLGKLSKKELQKHIEGFEFDKEKGEKRDKEYDPSLSYHDKDDMLGRVHPNKKL